MKLHHFCLAIRHHTDTRDLNSFAAQFIHPVYKNLFLCFCHQCVPSGLCLSLMDFNNMPIEPSRVQFYLVLFLRVWGHVLESHRRESMLWLVTVHYRLIKARGKELSPAQSFMQFDGKRSCKQTSLRVLKVVWHWLIFLPLKYLPTSVGIDDTVATWMKPPMPFMLPRHEQPVICSIIFSRWATTL